MSAAGRTIPFERVALGGANVLSCLVRLETLQGYPVRNVGNQMIWRIRLETGGLAHATSLFACSQVFMWQWDSLDALDRFSMLRSTYCRI